jgi:hypothetical protein
LPPARTPATVIGKLNASINDGLQLLLAEAR